MEKRHVQWTGRTVYYYITCEMCAQSRKLFDGGYSIETWKHNGNTKSKSTHGPNDDRFVLSRTYGLISQPKLLSVFFFFLCFIIVENRKNSRKRSITTLPPYNIPVFSDEVYMYYGPSGIGCVTCCTYWKERSTISTLKSSWWTAVVRDGVVGI